MWFVEGYSVYSDPGKDMEGFKSKMWRRGSDGDTTTVYS